MRLVLIAHAVADVEPAYRTALAPFGPVTVKPFISPHPGMSSSYVTLAHSLRNGGRVLPNLIARYAPGNWDSVVLVTWSAGYALARELLSIAADFADLDGLVMLDSLHCSSEINACTAQLTPFMHYAHAAQQGRKVLFVGHSDVPTTGYMSTTKAAAKLVEMAGPPRAGFIVRGYDTVPGRTVADYQREHVNAVRGWGTAAAAEAVGKLVSFDAAPDTDRTPPRAFTPAATSMTGTWRDRILPLPERCVIWCEAEMAAGVKEEPAGSNTSPRIRQYLEPCARRETGKALDLKEAPWCAAAQCFAQRECLMSGEAGAHGYFCSGVELEASAKIAKTWRGPGWTPSRGDLVILRRAGSGSDASEGNWERHVVRVLEMRVSGAAVFMRTIGGNESNRWGTQTIALDDDRIVGFIEYPRLIPRDIV